MKKKTISLIIIAIGVAAIVSSVFFFQFQTRAPGKTNASPSTKNGSSRDTKLPHDTTSFECLKYAVEKLLHSDSMRHAAFGFYLSDPDSGKVILEFNSEQSLVPASVMKIVTTGTCLNKLGPDFHYTTRLQYDGTINKATKVLEGNIYIKGSGDPTLGSTVFGESSEEKVLESWGTAIKNLGIDSVYGAIVGDADVFDEDMIPAGWAWEDMQSDYGIGPCGLSFHENVFDINVKGNRTKPDFTVTQCIPGLSLINCLGVNKNGVKDHAYASGSPYMNERYLRGAVTANDQDLVAQSAIPDPAHYCAHALYLHLKKLGIAVRDSSTTTRRLRLQNKTINKERISFHNTHSPPLASIIWHTNHVSQNFYAESLLRTLSLMETGYGSTPGGVNIVYEYFKQNGINTGGFYMVDGSGVSRFDAISVKQLVKLLEVYRKDTMNFDTFYNSLPVAGQSGTLSSICKGTAAEKNVRAKSGYMSRVRSYAGYVTTKSGRTLTFAMIANNYGYDIIGMRNQLEKLMVLMAELD